ncbi:MAG: DMT family transporter [Pseudomonadota bacterium]
MPAINALHGNQSRAGLYFALAGAITFSLKPILIKLVYQHGVATETLMALRMAFAFPIFLIVGWYSSRRTAKTRTLDKRYILYSMAVGILGYYGAAYFDLLGLTYITAQFERMLLFIYPTFVCFLAWLIFSEKISRRLLLALPLSYGGVVLIFLHDFSSLGSDAITGSVLVLASALCFAVYFLFSKPCISQLGSAMFTCIAMGTASVVIGVHFAFTRPIDDLFLPTPVLMLTMLIGVVATALPAFLISAAIGRIGASQTSVITSIGPIATAALAVSLLGESFTIYHAAGMAMTLGGIVYLSRE